MNQEYKLSQRSMLRLDGVCPGMQLIVTEAIKVSPIDFGIPRDGGVRSATRQNEMYLDPEIKTHCDGYTKKSRHQIRPGERFGDAFDVFAYVDHRASWADHHLSMVAAVILSTAKRLKKEGLIDFDIRWGGTFNSKNFDGWDKPHFEKVI